jgi:hypothetical protein
LKPRLPPKQPRLGIPIAHLHGGEITQGANDDATRHAITKLAGVTARQPNNIASGLFKWVKHPTLCIASVRLDWTRFAAHLCCHGPT